MQEKDSNLQIIFDCKILTSKTYLGGKKIASHCTCAGKFETLIVAKDLAKLLKTFKSIATHYGMPLLKEVVQWNIKMAGLHV